MTINIARDELAKLLGYKHLVKSRLDSALYHLDSAVGERAIPADWHLKAPSIEAMHTAVVEMSEELDAVKKDLHAMYLVLVSSGEVSVEQTQASKLFNTTYEVSKQW